MELERPLCQIQPTGLFISYSRGLRSHSMFLSSHGSHRILQNNSTAKDRARSARATSATLCYWGNWEPRFPKGATGSSQCQPLMDRECWRTREGTESTTAPTTLGAKGGNPGDVVVQKPRGRSDPAGAVPMRRHKQLGCCVRPHSGPWEAATAHPHERN